MKVSYWLFVAAVTTVGSVPAVAADPADPREERTSMPEQCSERNVTCVLQDGPPSRIAHPRTTAPLAGSLATTAPSPSTGASMSTSGKGSAGAAVGGAKTAASGPSGFGRASH